MKMHVLLLFCFKIIVLSVSHEPDFPNSSDDLWIGYEDEEKLYLRGRAVPFCIFFQNVLQ